MRTSTLLCALVVAVVATGAWGKAVYPCGDWVLYKQCGESWSNHALGTSSLTICQAGCAMSSVSMSLATYAERINGETSNPGTLNAYLTSNSGYVDENLIVWNAVAPLGTLHLESATSTMTQGAIRDAVDQCQPVIVNVRAGSHWVLVTGYDTENENTFYVNDPGFNDASYDYTGMSNFIVYDNATMTNAIEDMAAALRGANNHKAAIAPTPAHQRTAALHADATNTLPKLGDGGGKYGVDVSSPVSQSAFSCMKNQHDVSYVIIRSYTELGSSDSAVVGTAKAARAAGIDVSVYHFPDTRKDARSQALADINYLREHGVSFSGFWVDVERSDWGSNTTFNTHFIQELAETARGATDATVGVYTSQSQWQPITGDSHALEDFPLWWPTYNYQPNFDDFRAFGGWSQPTIHQYKGNINLCGAGVDVNWKP